jgi:hypothetical protein
MAEHAKDWQNCATIWFTKSRHLQLKTDFGDLLRAAGASTRSKLQASSGMNTSICGPLGDAQHGFACADQHTGNGHLIDA